MLDIKLKFMLLDRALPGHDLLDGRLRGAGSFDLEKVCGFLRILHRIEQFLPAISRGSPSYRYDINVRQVEPRVVETCLNSKFGKTRKVLDSIQPLFSDCANRYTVDNQGC